MFWICTCCESRPSVIAAGSAAFMRGTGNIAPANRRHQQSAEGGWTSRPAGVPIVAAGSRAA